MLEVGGAADAEALATHFLAAGELAKGSLYAERAADEARQSLAFLHAAHWYERAHASDASSRERSRRLETKLGESNRTRVISWVRTHDYYIERSYKADTRMAVLLGVTIFMLISMTALGIVGLASFSVNARVKQIGTRRAVGARRLDILRYFMLENWVLTTAGVLVGCGLAYYFSYWLSSAYEVPMSDFAEFFRPNTGIIWAFYEENLSSRLLRSGTRFTPRPSEARETVPMPIMRNQTK